MLQERNVASKGWEKDCEWNWKRESVFCERETHIQSQTRKNEKKGTQANLTQLLVLIKKMNSAVFSNPNPLLNLCQVAALDKPNNLLIIIIFLITILELEKYS